MYYGDDGTFQKLLQIRDQLDVIRVLMVFILILLIFITALLITQVCMKLYKMHTTSLRERYMLNAANCIQGGLGKAAPTPTITV